METKDLGKIGEAFDGKDGLFQIKNPVTGEIRTATDEDCKVAANIVSEMNVQPFGWDSEEGPTNQDYFTTIQYNLNHGKVGDLGLSKESEDFIKNSGFFTI